MSKYTIVNQNTCIACGTCGDIAPDIFSYTDSGEAYVKLDDNQGCSTVPEDFYDDLEDAELNCPSKSIKVSEKSFENIRF